MDPTYHDEGTSGIEAAPEEDPVREDVLGEVEAGEELDETRLQMAVESMRAEENFPLGVAAGLVGALGGALIWAAITVATGYQIGWMAVGVGFLVGFAVRAAGKGMTQKFAIAGAALALLGCLLGNIFSICGFIGVQQEMSPVSVFFQLDPATTVELLRVTFSPMDLLFYVFAVYEGYKLSLRQVSEEDLMERYRTVG